MSRPAFLPRFLQLASPMLPVGAYSYSQGFESAIESGQVRNAAEARDWIGDVLELYLGRFELPHLWRMICAWSTGTDPAFWNDQFLAGRDTAESRSETLQTGYSLVRLIEELDGFSEGSMRSLRAVQPVSYPLVYAFVVVNWQIPTEDAILAYAWAWLENQVSVAMKAIPIGQVAGQRILLALGEVLPKLAASMADFDDDDLSNFAPGLAIAGCRHETQYSRLFRS